MSSLFHKIAHGKRSIYWFLRYKDLSTQRLKEINLKVTDKQVAQEIKRKILKEAELEYAGLMSPKSIREASKRPISEHLQDFYFSMVNKKEVTSRHYDILKKRIQIVCKVNHWEYLNQISLDGLDKYLSNQNLNNKTKNDYLSAFNTFLTWLIEHGRLENNPIIKFKPYQVLQNGSHRYALTKDEIIRLIAVTNCPYIKTAFMLAFYCGLRRGEIEKLKWSDIELSNNPTLTLQAATTKNRKASTLPLHSDLVCAIEAIKPKGDLAEKLLIPHLPRFRTLKKYWIKAGISLKVNGKNADFHGLRTTRCTMMAKSGVPLIIAAKAMRWCVSFQMSYQHIF